LALKNKKGVKILRKILGLIIGMISFVIGTGVVFAATGNLDAYISLLKLFFSLIKELFAKDIFQKPLLYCFVAIPFFGGLNLSRKTENKIWTIVGFISSLIELLTLGKK